MFPARFPLLVGILHQRLEGKGRNRSGRHGMLKEVTDASVHLAAHPFEHLDSHSESFQRIKRLVVVV